MSYILVGHGAYAMEIVRSCAMITGEQAMFHPVVFSDEMSAADLMDRFAHIFSEQDVSAIIVDILGGTPSNAAQMFAASHAGVEVVTGLSLPLVLPLVFGETLDAALAAAKEGLQRVSIPEEKGRMSKNEEGEEED
ncbi:PTS sugar transporter subunit IIA [Listeria costaricensis]|uniref:PTS sugar transporter subunit IIA n=1 Tax=Listeria costaricensis TaxID=2026604 RepID=UPI000C077F41|nr:PTS fructose transporter subunit IIA [Listeria costaricensis]